MIEKVSLKAEIEKQLEEKKTLSSADIEAAAQKIQQPEHAAVPETEDTKVKAKDVLDDPMVKAGLKRNEDKTYTPELADDDSSGFTDLHIEADEELEITAQDKQNFLKALVDGTRFTRTFSIYDGRLTGAFRARTNAESSAIITEMTRRVNIKPMLMEVYAQKMRHALLHCMLSKYQGVDRKEWSGDIAAVEVIKDGKTEIQEPQWYVDMETVFKGKDEGITLAIYAELRRFEKIYWTLVRNAGDQNFWNPEASSIE